MLLLSSLPFSYTNSRADISYNKAGREGGGLWITGATASINFASGASIIGNTAAVTGGGALLIHACTVTFGKDTVLANNSAQHGAAAYLGYANTLMNLG